MHTHSTLQYGQLTYLEFHFKTVTKVNSLAGVQLQKGNYVLSLFRLDFSATEKDWGQNGPPPNLAISSQIMLKLGMEILWVEIFSNW